MQRAALPIQEQSASQDMGAEMYWCSVTPRNSLALCDTFGTTPVATSRLKVQKAGGVLTVPWACPRPADGNGNGNGPLTGRLRP
ncbi:hypothetical protein AC579_1788 [Pseudocercospora musae]|uniref:Uncharacterized protein n=1 Tax=Pseudocercospora musae TaxID=113226 RepID=A0A139INW7_9PEZI|nr:hypothetical protein AC579_1788 [Pseudocercospora musae]